MAAGRRDRRAASRGPCLLTPAVRVLASKADRDRASRLPGRLSEWPAALRACSDTVPWPLYGTPLSHMSAVQREVWACSQLQNVSAHVPPAMALSLCLSQHSSHDLPRYSLEAPEYRCDISRRTGRSRLRTATVLTLCDVRFCWTSCQHERRRRLIPSGTSTEDRRPVFSCKGRRRRSRPTAPGSVGRCSGASRLHRLRGVCARVST